MDRRLIELLAVFEEQRHTSLIGFLLLALIYPVNPPSYLWVSRGSNAPKHIMLVIKDSRLYSFKLDFAVGKTVRCTPRPGFYFWEKPEIVFSFFFFFSTGDLLGKSMPAHVWKGE